MLTRQKTLAQNVAIYASLVVLLLVHGWFWGSWLRGAKENITKLDKDLSGLKTSVEDLRRDTEKVKQEVEETRAELEKRRKELDSLGNFLPSIKQKPTILKEILKLVELPEDPATGRHITITKTDFPPPEAPTSGGGYSTVTFILELTGPYVCFKQLLAKLQQTKMIIRVSKFELKDPGKDAPYDWRVQITFQTYFES
jgi:hypothetical protein